MFRSLHLIGFDGRTIFLLLTYLRIILRPFRAIVTQIVHLTCSRILNLGN